MLSSLLVVVFPGCSWLRKSTAVRNMFKKKAMMINARSVVLFCLL